MVQQDVVQATASLRTIIYRISATPTQQLPYIASQIAGLLWNCKPVLSSTHQTSKSNNEVATLIHQLKTTLSSLLQDRTPEGRWTGVIITKATIEAGGFSILNECGPWVRYLLAILKKPDPPTTRKLTTITLTRIFMLTWDYPKLVRELTTPNLPAFISTCLNNIQNSRRCSASELQTVLETFTKLLPRHPTIFRPFESQTRSFVIKVLASTPSNPSLDTLFDEKHKEIARRLLVALHHCSSKPGPAEKWNETITATISCAHMSCDSLFKPLESVRHSTSMQRGEAATPNHANGTAKDSLGFTPADGIFATAERLTTLLGILEAHISTATATAIMLPVGNLVSLINRTLEIAPSKSESSTSSKSNPSMSRNEQEALYSILIDVHITTLKLIETLLSSYGKWILSIVHGFLEPVLDLFRAEKSNIHIRTNSYRITKVIISLIGTSLSREDIAELSPVLQACCNDLLPPETEKASAATNAQNVPALKANANSDLSLVPTEVQSSNPTLFPELSKCAKFLLVTGLTKLNTADMPRKLRVQMERTAVLTNDREAMVAAVMNPAKNDHGAGSASLLPLLASMYPESEEVEALIRPRMPVILTRKRSADVEMDFEEEAESVGSDKEVEGMDLENGRAALEDALQDRIAGAGNVDEDDLYTATPPRRLGDDVRIDLDNTSTKRPAANILEDSISAKRLRGRDVAEALEREATNGLAEPNSAISKASLPITVAYEQQDAEAAPKEMAVLPEQPVAGPTSRSSMQTEAMNNDSEDDDSDFEIPALTMEE